MSLPSHSRRPVRAVFGMVRGLLRAVFGEVSWRPPVWASAYASSVRARPGRFLLLPLLVIAALAAGSWQWRRWQQSRPKPRPEILVVAKIIAPEAAPLPEKGKRVTPKPLAIEFDAVAIPITTRLDDKRSAPAAPGIARLEPELAGKWMWSGDRRLSFFPDDDWPADTALRVTLDPTKLATDVKLAQATLETRTAPLTVTLRQAEFYQDPKDLGVKQVTATLEFSHPVARAEVEKRLQAGAVGGSDVFGDAATDKRWTLVEAEERGSRVFYFRTAPLRLPENEDFLRVLLREGVPTNDGGKAITSAAAEAKVRVPDRFAFFKIDSASTLIALTEKGDPELMLFVNTSAAARPEDVLAALSLHLLPARNPNVKRDDEDKKDGDDGEEEEDASPRRSRGEDADDEEASNGDQEEGDASAKEPPPAFDEWTANEVTTEIIGKSAALPLKAVVVAEESGTEFRFRFAADREGKLFLRLGKGAKAVGGFTLREDFTQVLEVPVPKREIRIEGDGGVLALSGERKLLVRSRGVAAIAWEIARVSPDQVNHLVSMTEGTFQQPDMRSSTFGWSNLARFADEVQPVALRSRLETNESVFDFTKHLRPAPGDPRFRQGLFYLRARAWDPATKKPVKGFEPTARFVLVTDLGLIAKANADGTREVFVASLRTGLPMASVSVDIVARNGSSLGMAVTGADGRAALPAVEKLAREQTAAAFVARRGEDLAFLPFKPRDRGLDFSRWDAGGVEVRSGADLDAFVFTERGVYRPGDAVRVGMIVHRRDWAPGAADLPVELEVIDPAGNKKRVQRFNLPASGFAESKWESEAESPTGEYSFRLHVLREGKRVAVLGSTEAWLKEFLPDTMKIYARLLLPEGARGWVSPADMKAEVTLQNLYGTPAASRRTKGTLRLAPAEFAFEPYPGWTFFDGLGDQRGEKKKPEEQTVELGEQKTDDQGRASYDLALERFADAAYALTFGVEGFEGDSGRSVATKARVLVSALPLVVGWKPDGALSELSVGGPPRKLQFIALDPALQRVATGPLKLTLSQRKTISVLTKQDNGSYRYESVPRLQARSTETVEIPVAGWEWPVPITEAGRWEMELRDEQDVRVARVEFTVAGAGAQPLAVDRDAELELRLPRREYRAGDTVEIAINAPYAGAGLITIERERVLAHRWFGAAQPGSVQRIRLPADLDGPAYVNVCLIRALDSREIYRSPLSYAVAPIVVNRDKRRLPISLHAPAEVKPGEKLRIAFKTDRPAKIAVFAVDKGILQVSDYALPDPVDHFFRKAALGVRTSQIVDQLLPEFSLLRQGSAPGGDGDDKTPKVLNPFRRVTDQPVVYWSGVIEAGPKEREVTYEVPEYFNGTLALMAVAVSPDAVGSAETRALVRGSFVVSPSVPTAVAPGDTFECAVTVANNVEGSGDAARVRLTATPSEHLEIVGQPTADLAVAENREVTTTFTARARERLGGAQIVFRAEGAKGDPRQARATLSVRPATPLLTVVRSGTVKGGATDVPVSRTMHPEFRRAEVTLSATPLGLARGLEAYLRSYPNGCTEQVVSGAFARMVLADEADFGLSRADALAQARRVYGILGERQAPGGGFAYWPGNDVPSIDFISSYAAHFLIDAKAARLDPPEGMLAKAREFLRGMTAKEPGSLRDARIIAYGIWLLTREGVVTTNYVVNLRDWLDRRGPKEWKRDLTAAYLAGALALLHKDAEARALIEEARPGRLDARDWWDFCQPLGADAQLAAILAAHFPERLRSWGGPDLAYLLEPIQRGHFNTLSSAYAILALREYARLAKASAPELRVVEQRASGPAAALALGGSAVLRSAPFSAGASALRFEAPGGGNAWWQVLESGFDVRPPEGGAAEGLEISRDLLSADGKPATRAKLGAAVIVRIRFRAKGPATVSNVAVLDLLPGGFEIAENSLTPGAGRQGMAYVDVREDRVVFFGDATSTTRELTYAIKPASRGEFTVPPVAAEAMYDRAVFARGIPGRITVANEP